MMQPSYGGSNHGHGGNPLRILAAESYLDGNTLSIAQSLTELAQQPAHDLTLRWQFEQNREGSGTATPPILKARQADVEMNRHADRRKSSGAQTGEQVTERSEEPEEDRSAKKKRKRKNHEDDDGGNDAEKKTRGRPRLDTKDESAADRRRTQIRMAQRAYRDRKETTITSLEKKVEHLQSMADEMNNAFIGLYDLALAKGLLQKEPEFGAQLQSATQRFLTLAKSADGDETNTLEDSSSPRLSVPALPKDRAETAIQQQGSHRPLPKDDRSNKLTTTSVWGYEITNSSVDEVADTTYTTERWFDQRSMPSLPKRTEHEIIAHPTEENASFPFDMYHNDAVPDSSQRDYQVNFATTTNTISPNPFTSIQLTAAFDPWVQPPLPITYAHQESSFGRRLHRIITERGYDLLMNPHRSTRTYERVFGLSLRMYGKEKLAEAMRRVIVRHKSEPLSQWDLPFIHLGGSGAHFPPSPEDESHMPKVGTGRSIGPLTELISESQEKYLLDNFRAKVPGYEGLWFDTYDVESYLKKRGIHIPPSTEWLNIDLAKVNLVGVTAPATNVTPFDSSTQTSLGTTATPPSPHSPYLNSLGMQDRQQTVQNVDASLEFFMAGMGNNFATNSFTAPFVTGTSQNFGINWPEDNASYSQPGEIQQSDGTLDFTSSEDAVPFLGNATSETSEESQRIVTISITTLMEAILRKGICLGRAPGFRPYDVDKALRTVIQEAR